MIFMVIVVSIFLVLFGYTNTRNKIPSEVYKVYLDGDEIGNISSKEKFEELINVNQEALKKKYEVDNIYAPKGVEIKKVITYNNKLDNEIVVYDKINNKKPFTVKGTIITITDSDGNKKYINVLKKSIFDDALKIMIKAFVGEESYTKYMNGTQDKIEDEGSTIENISSSETITYKEDLISTNEDIFMDADNLARYLMYGTTNLQTTYTVKAGETIEEIANNNRMNVQEFLIANPQFTNANNLLYESQQVIVELTNPLINIVVEKTVVEIQEKAFQTEIQYDSDKNIGYQEEVRAGENGSYLVVSTAQYINGQLTGSSVNQSTELKPAINRILVKGDKYVPSVADLSYWAWPTKTPYTVTTNYQYRWGEFHGAIDITGTGYGSDIYAANNGTVYKVGSGHKTRGVYVIIKHNVNNLYTIYQHLASYSVVEGQTVTRGQRIGAMGNSGFVSPKPSASNPYAGTHLHFAFFYGPPGEGGQYTNPWNFYR